MSETTETTETKSIIPINPRLDAESNAIYFAMEAAIEEAEQTFYEVYRDHYEHHMNEAGYTLSEEELNAAELKGGENLWITTIPEACKDWWKADYAWCRHGSGSLRPAASAGSALASPPRNRCGGGVRWCGSVLLLFQGTA